MIAVAWALASCRPPGPAESATTTPEGEVQGIDTSSLTSRERNAWWTQVSEQLAPCPDQPVTIAQCVNEHRDCASCTPAAKLLMDQVKLGKTSEQVESAFRARFDPGEVESIDISGSPAKGPDDASVVIVEWADFECPFCARASPLLSQLQEHYSEHVKVVFKHFPISHHQHAALAARAGVAAHRQGKFWELHDLMFANQSALDEAGLRRLAEQAGLDIERFEADLKSEATAAVVERDRQQADQLGLEGTPMIYINGRYFSLQQFDLEQDLEPWVRLDIELHQGGGEQQP